MATTDKEQTQALIEQNKLLAEQVALMKVELGSINKQLKQAGLAPQKPKVKKKLEEQPWYVKPGSDRHAYLLGLTQDEESDLGWRLQDVTSWGPAARPEFLEQILVQRVNELTAPIPVIQSEDPLAANYAVPLWVPSEGEPV